MITPSSSSRACSSARPRLRPRGRGRSARIRGRGAADPPARELGMSPHRRPRGHVERKAEEVFVVAARRTGVVEGCPEVAAREWGPRGPHGHVPAHALKHLPRCSPPWVLDLPVVSGYVAARRLGCSSAATSSPRPGPAGTPGVTGSHARAGVEGACSARRPVLAVELVRTGEVETFAEAARRTGPRGLPSPRRAADATSSRRPRSVGASRAAALPRGRSRAQGPHERGSGARARGLARPREQRLLPGRPCWRQGPATEVRSCSSPSRVAPRPSPRARGQGSRRALGRDGAGDPPSREGSRLAADRATLRPPGEASQRPRPR